MFTLYKEDEQVRTQSFYTGVMIFFWSETNWNFDAFSLNRLSANNIKWSNTIKYLSVFDHFVELALKGLKYLTFVKLCQSSKLLNTFSNNVPPLYPLKTSEH